MFQISSDLIKRFSFGQNDSLAPLTEYSFSQSDLLGTVNEVFQLHNISNLPNQTLVHIMLYGHKSFTHDQNRQILESTLKFIHLSERFL